MNELTDGGDYKCHAMFDYTNETDIHFSIHVNCELNKCHHNARTIVNEMPATTIVVAPIELKHVTTIGTPHLTTISTIANRNSMVKEISHNGVGKSSFTKRHTSSSESILPLSSNSVLQSNQHFNLSDVEITTTTTDSISTTRSTVNVDFNRSHSKRSVKPTPSMDKTKRWG